MARTKQVSKKNQKRKAVASPQQASSHEVDSDYEAEMEEYEEQPQTRTRAGSSRASSKGKEVEVDKASEVEKASKVLPGRVITQIGCVGTNIYAQLVKHGLIPFMSIRDDFSDKQIEEFYDSLDLDCTPENVDEHVLSGCVNGKSFSITKRAFGDLFGLNCDVEDAFKEYYASIFPVALGNVHENRRVYIHDRTQRIGGEDATGRFVTKAIQYTYELRVFFKFLSVVLFQPVVRINLFNT